MYCRPSQILKPTGGTWWDDTIIIADEYYGHLLRVQSSDTSVLLAGLDEPYHIDIDRRLLAISNLGTNRVICGKVQPGGVLADLWEIDSALGTKLNRPHGVFQGNNYSIIADTDNHRILWKLGHFQDRESHWQQWDKKVSFPCDVHGAGNRTWIADTFNHRILRLNLNTCRSDLSFGKVGSSPLQMSFPVSICQWNSYLFVTDEQNKRIQVFEILKNQTKQITHNLAASFIRSPLGLCVNMNSYLLITDRTQGCCWTIDLKLWMETLLI